jgi:4a-hydroxytetrahydrobiopterin dehydratase
MATPRAIPRPLTVTRAWTYLGINLFATPGLGSYMGGRKAAGAGQLCLSVTGFLLITTWMFKTFYGVVSAEMNGTDSVATAALWWQAGTFFFALAWLWSLVTSISLVREAGSAPVGTPPPLSSLSSPPRLAEIPASIPTIARPSSVRLPVERLASAFLTVPAWRRQGDAIVRTFQFPDFPAAVTFVNQVAALAEAAAHHPDIDIRWNRVTLLLTTHDAGGLTEKDFSLARQVDQI